MATPFKRRRKFFAKRQHSYGHNYKRKNKIITGIIDAAIVTASVAIAWLIFAVVAHFTFARPEANFASNVTRISAIDLKKQVVANYPWKVFWEGPLDSKQFVLQNLTDGVAQIMYISPKNPHASDRESFIIYSARSEADRMNSVRRINPINEITDTTPAGNKIVFDTNNMAAVRIYLENGIAAIQFPTPQTLDEFKSTADSLVAIN